MKIGPVEGTSEEVNDFFQNNGLNLSEYLQKPEPPLSNIWLIIPAILFVFSFGVLSITQIASANWKVFVFLLGFASSVWLGVSVHIRFKSSWSAWAIILAGLLIMLVALGVIEPKELLEHYDKSTK